MWPWVVAPCLNMFEYAVVPKQRVFRVALAGWAGRRCHQVVDVLSRHGGADPPGPHKCQTGAILDGLEALEDGRKARPRCGVAGPRYDGERLVGCGAITPPALGR